MMNHNCTVEEIDALYAEKTSWFRRLKLKWLKNAIISSKINRCSEFFKSATGIRLEKERQLKSKYPFVIHPLSYFRYVYLGVPYTSIGHYFI